MAPAPSTGTPCWRPRVGPAPRGRSWPSCPRATKDAALRGDGRRAPSAACRHPRGQRRRRRAPRSPPALRTRWSTACGSPTLGSRAWRPGLRATGRRCPTRSGTVVRGQVLPNGLQLTQIRVPLGVVAIIYEARPNVTVDAAGHRAEGRKCGAAAGIRPRRTGRTRRSSTSWPSAASAAGLPGDAVQLVPGTDRESVNHLMTARGLVDVIIPRGGAGLIQARGGRIRRCR